MQPTIQLDTRVFNAVLKQKAALCRNKTFPEIVNRTALDVNFRVLKETDKANAAEIRALPQQEWWPKYVAKRIMGGFSFRKGKAKINIQGRHTREDARKVSQKIIASRVRSVGFHKAGWLPALRRLLAVVRDRVLGGSAGGARQYGQPKGSVRVATAGDHPTCTMTNSAEGIDRKGVAALQRAVDGSAADMRVYIGRKLEEAARRVAR